MRLAARLVSLPLSVCTVTFLPVCSRVGYSLYLVCDSLVDSQGHDDPQLLVQKLGQKSVDSEQAGQTTVDSNAAAQLDDSPNSFAGLMGVDSKVADESPLGFCVDPNAETQAMNPIEFNSQLDRNWYTELNQNYEL